jgi:hypothetical protein
LKGRTEQEHPEWKNACQYQEYVVILLDVLGFSKLINDVKNNVIFAGLFDTINSGAEKSRCFLKRGFLLKHGFDDLKTCVISDTIVLSLYANTNKLFEKLNRLLFMVLSSFADENILLRGAITKGLLYHEKNIVFGPALVRAHQLEQYTANNPRCILDAPFVTDLEKNLTPSDENLIRNFTEDADGYKYFDIFYVLCRNSKDDPRFSITLNRIHDTIVENLDKYKNPRNNEEKNILGKNVWCKYAFNNAISATESNQNLMILD